jgi:hypothetical protein
MRIAAALAAIALAGGPLLAEEAPAPAPTTTVPQGAPPASETTQQTVLEGTLPDLAGRWFALAHLRIPGGRARTAPAFWEIAPGDDGKLAVRVRFVALPPAQRRAMEEANNAERAWTPSPADLDAIAAAWETLPPEEPKVAIVETAITGRDAFSEAARKEPLSQDALWLVQQTYTFDASGAPGIRQVFAYAPLAPAGSGYTGNYSTVLLAAAPFPIPITFEGTFHLHRLGSGQRGLVERLLDLLRGCGRS